MFGRYSDSQSVHCTMVKKWDLKECDNGRWIDIHPQWCYTNDPFYILKIWLKFAYYLLKCIQLFVQKVCHFLVAQLFCIKCLMRWSVYKSDVLLLSCKYVSTHKKYYSIFCVGQILYTILMDVGYTRIKVVLNLGSFPRCHLLVSSFI